MRKKRVKRLAIVAFIIAFLVAMYFCIGIPMLAFVNDHDSLSRYVNERGIYGWIYFGALIVVQTMSTCIPGTPFYMASGFVLGGLKGALLCDLCATIGNTIAFLLGRKYGKNLLLQLFSKEKLDKVEQYIDEKNPVIIHILFMLLPLPKDLYAWLGYYSKEPLLKWFIITFICRFPHIFLYCFGGSLLLQKNYWVIICGGAFAVLVYGVLMIYLKKTKSTSSDAE